MGFSQLNMGGFSLGEINPCEIIKHPLCGCEPVCYTKNHLFVYNGGVQATNINEKVISMAKKANKLAHTKWMC
jgi:hypothetical protein